MIFSGEHNGTSHIEMILNGGYFLPSDNLNNPVELRIVKTQTRRWSPRVPVPVLYQRYRVGQLYAIQPGRTKPGLEGVKIKITRKWIETTDVVDPTICFPTTSHERYYLLPIPISEADAQAEGGYTVEEYEVVFRELNPKWDHVDRVGLEFGVVRV